MANLNDSVVDRTERACRLALDELRESSLTLAVAESLTGGMVCSKYLEIPGASTVFKGGVISYATEVKCNVLGVSQSLLAEYGAVDPQVALEMANGVREALGADVGLATTGVAGPGVAEGKPVGTVYVAVAGNLGWSWKKLNFTGERQEVREKTTMAACELLVTWLDSELLGDAAKKSKLSA